jgi:hypothetical protein
MLTSLCGTALYCTSSGLAEVPADRPFSDQFNERKEDLVPQGTNPFFILEPGNVMEYRGKEDGDETELIISVLEETRKVDGVKTRIVEERESSGGKLKEISRNYFAFSKRSSNIYYFGEDSKSYKNGKPVGSEGSWEAGKNKAHYGLMMPGVPLLGSRYYQEIAPGTAMDRAENISTSETLQTPAGNFEHCLLTEETSPLEPDSREHKYYAPGIGLIKDGGLLLVRHGHNSTAKPASHNP